MSFTTTELTQNRVLVEGTDRLGFNGRTVLDSSQWQELKADRGHSDAHAEFDAAVNDFYAPLLAAVEKIEASHLANRDDLFEVVVQEGEDGKAAVEEIRVALTKDSAILRLLEQGDEARLIWVGDSLEITAPVVLTPVAAEIVSE